MARRKHKIDIGPDINVGRQMKVSIGDGVRINTGNGVKSVPEMLRECAGVFEERAAVYGDNYKHFGKVMMGLFPDGLALHTEDDFSRFGVLVQAMSKATRYAQNFYRGGHDDSCIDISVYMTMLRELDKEVAERQPRHPLED